MTPQPLAEVFGYPITNFSPTAERHRRLRLCPFHNRVPNCTKDRANDPLGVCSIHDGGQIAITCPIRFRQDWKIAEDAASFFFADGTHWTTLSEIRLNDQQGQIAGNIDMVLVAYDERGKIIDFGTLEIQAVYISGNVRRPFESYMQKAAAHQNVDWMHHRGYPRPDYLSSSRKRLAPQLLYKGSIIHAWGKKQAVVVDRGFFDTLPSLEAVEPDQAEMIWLVYELVLDDAVNQYGLTLSKTVYTSFESVVERITDQL